jgi:hypothetical protein
MRAIEPYRTFRGAARALDNGGRFYNLLTQAGDQVVEAAELARAAGVHSAGAQAFVHFEMALMALPPAEKAEIIGRLAPQLKLRYQKHRPAFLAPSAVEERGRAGATAMVEGYPVFVEDKTQVKGFVIMVVPVMAVIPIVDLFDVYEVYDTREMNTPRTVIATVRGSKRLEGVWARFGGVLKEMQFEDKTGKDHGLYLEAMYYTPLGSEK